MHRWTSLALIGLLVFASACDSATPDDGGPPDAGAPRPPSTVGPADRPARLFSPAAHDGTTPLPLVMLLHGHGVDAMLQDLYFGMTRRARTDGFYLLLPDGTLDADDQPHWDVLGVALDDHAYLRGLLEETMALVPVARGSVFVVGHSNGGFMAYRLACDSADLVTGIASFAGSDATLECDPVADVSVLQIHGSVDGTVAYEGGTIAGLTYGAADEAVAAWATRAGCTGTATGPPLDLVADIDGAETTALEHTGGCRAGAALWTMEGADHIPALTDAFTPSVIDWLRAHAR